MRHLVVGLGEVGRALRDVFVAAGHDPALSIHAYGRCQFLHIAIPYSEKFSEIVRDYQRKFAPLYTIVHSTVPVGTCRSLGVAHSAIRGKHPHLFESIQTFKKFVGGEGAASIVKEFRRFGIDARIAPSADDSEAMKLWDLAQFYWSIMVMREIHSYCEARGLDFNHVYAEANASYNDGYRKLGHPEYTRPVLRFEPGPTGGHCVKQNVPMLGGKIAEILQEHEAAWLDAHCSVVK